MHFQIVLRSLVCAFVASLDLLVDKLNPFFDIVYDVAWTLMPISWVWVDVPCSNCFAYAFGGLLFAIHSWVEKN